MFFLTQLHNTLQTRYYEILITFLEVTQMVLDLNCFTKNKISHQVDVSFCEVMLVLQGLGRLVEELVRTSL